MLPQLFQPFNRLGQESSTEEGTGIGLVMSKRLVELMGGAIGVESTVGRGQRVLVRAELGRGAATWLWTTPSRGGGPDAGRRSGAPLRTLLYVEDNPANLKLVEQLIARRPDMRLLSARDGNLGIQLARAHQPEVILMDINLPGISGIEALKILRDDPPPRTSRSSPSAPMPCRATSKRACRQASSAISPSPSKSMSSWTRWT